MKKIAAVILLLALLITATGCRSMERVTIYQDESIAVDRQGRTTYITETKTGNTFSCKQTRTRSTSDARTASTGTNTDTISIKTVFNIVIVDEKDTGQTIYIKG